MKKTRMVFALVGVLLLTLALAGIAKDTLTIYTAFDADQAQVYIEAFEASHPNIDVEWVRLSSGEVYTRLQAEAANPQASLWFGGSNTSHIAAAKAGLLEPYKKSLAWQYIAPQFKDPAGMWIGLYVGYIGFVSNTDFLASAGVDAPTSWQDLLKPEFKGEITIAYAFASGTAYTTLAGMLTAIGSPDPGFDSEDEAYVAAFSAQVGQYNSSGSAAATMVGQGEFGVGIVFSHDILKKAVAPGYPVVMTFPEEGTSYEIGGMALIKGGPQLELAKVFYDWAMTKEAQDLYEQFYRLPLNPEANLAAGSVKATDVNVLPIDLVWYGDNKDAMLDKWSEVTGEY